MGLPAVGWPIVAIVGWPIVGRPLRARVVPVPGFCGSLSVGVPRLDPVACLRGRGFCGSGFCGSCVHGPAACVSGVHGPAVRGRAVRGSVDRARGRLCSGSLVLGVACARGRLCPGSLVPGVACALIYHYIYIIYRSICICEWLCLRNKCKAIASPIFGHYTSLYALRTRRRTHCVEL